VSGWLIVTDTRTNRRHAAWHCSLLRTRFPMDGRSFSSFLDNPVASTSGLAFWTDVHPGDVQKKPTRILTRVRAPKPAARPDSNTREGRLRTAKPDSTVRPDVGRHAHDAQHP